MRAPRTPPFRLRYVHSPAAGDSAAEASTKAGEAATADELAALLDGRSDEDAPVKYVRLVASLGKPDFFATFTIDEFSCTRRSTTPYRRQDVMAAAFALRHLRLETQSRGNLHPHGNLYVAHSRVKNVASAHTYAAKYVAKDPSDAES